MLTKEQKKKAKILAKYIIEIELEKNEDKINKKIKEIKEIEGELNKFEAGVFVTLKIDKKLRGCIGFVEKRPLGKAIKEAAKFSAFYDPRFNPLTKEEFENIKIEITLLSEPKEIKNKEIQNIIKEIEIGKHGLMIKSNEGSGLLLPQVAIQHNFNPIEFLEATCIKAGLSKNSWLKDDVKIFKFEGIWF